ncbi:MAG: hypothetical protein K1X28_06740 [Parachlamydiales bacterium]|nr:hypothetical protein [Parachlamydiales bacterium]
MFFKQAIASALHLFVVFAFFTAGLFFVLLPYLPLTRIEIIDFLSNRYEQCTQIGMGLFLVALVFLIGFYALNRGKYLVIRIGLSADLRVVQHAIEDCFAKQFKKKISLKEVALGPKSYLDFKVQLAPIDEAAREDLFIEVEKHLSLLLHERFGYSKPFHLIVKI